MFLFDLTIVENIKEFLKSLNIKDIYIGKSIDD